ncbi:MAG TPA: hypothetical protein DEV81_17475 [Cyanobacteria bacterium UBA11049]|nr:hypothetical protein [Cyanobacteria bacterium UBA11049]
MLIFILLRLFGRYKRSNNKFKLSLIVYLEPAVFSLKVVAGSKNTTRTKTVATEENNVSLYTLFSNYVIIMVSNIPILLLQLTQSKHEDLKISVVSGVFTESLLLFGVFIKFL